MKSVSGLRQSAERLYGQLDGLLYTTRVVLGVGASRLPLSSSYPHTLQTLTQQSEWLVGALRLAGLIPFGASVSSVDVAPFKPTESLKSSMGRVMVSFVDRDGVEGQVRALAKFAPVGSGFRSEIVYTWQQVNEREAAFYQHLAPLVPIRVPKAYFAGATRFAGRMCLLLEEFQGVQEVDEGVGASLEQVEAVIDGMAQLHAHFWGVTDEEAKASWPQTQRVLGPEAVMDGLVWAKAPEAFHTIWRHTWRQARRNPLTLLHGDLRVGNVLFDEDTQPIFIDWQASRLGQGALDLAFFLTLSVDTALRREHQERWLVRYHRALVRHGVSDYSAQDFAEHFRLNQLYTLLLLALPQLSREVNVNEENATMSAHIADAWRERLRAYCDEIDHDWVANECGVTAEQSRFVLEFRHEEEIAEAMGAK